MKYHTICWRTWEIAWTKTQHKRWAGWPCIGPEMMMDDGWWVRASLGPVNSIQQNNFRPSGFLGPHACLFQNTATLGLTDYFSQGSPKYSINCAQEGRDKAHRPKLRGLTRTTTILYADMQFSFELWLTCWHAIVETRNTPLEAPPQERSSPGSLGATTTTPGHQEHWWPGLQLLSVVQSSCVWQKIDEQSDYFLWQSGLPWGHLDVTRFASAASPSRWTISGQARATGNKVLWSVPDFPHFFVSSKQPAPDFVRLSSAGPQPVVQIKRTVQHSAWSGTFEEICFQTTRWSRIP